MFSCQHIALQQINRDLVNRLVNFEDSVEVRRGRVCAPVRLAHARCLTEQVYARRKRAWPSRGKGIEDHVHGRALQKLDNHFALHRVAEAALCSEKAVPDTVEVFLHSYEVLR